MPHMLDVTIELAFFEARDARRDISAQIKFEGRGLTLLMADESGHPVMWHGERRGQGHFVLSAPEADMEASLHRFADSLIMEGFWRHGRERGFWRLHLPHDPVMPLDTRGPKGSVVALKPRAKAPRKRIRRVA